MCVYVGGGGKGEGRGLIVCKLGRCRWIVICIRPAFDNDQGRFMDTLQGRWLVIWLRFARLTSEPGAFTNAG